MTSARRWRRAPESTKRSSSISSGRLNERHSVANTSLLIGFPALKLCSSDVVNSVCAVEA